MTIKSKGGVGAHSSAVGSLPAVPAELRKALAEGLRSSFESPIRSSSTMGFLAPSESAAAELLKELACSRGVSQAAAECHVLIATALLSPAARVSCELPYELASQTPFFPAYHHIEIFKDSSSGVRVMLGTGEMSERGCTRGIFERRVSTAEYVTLKLLPLPNSGGVVCVSPGELCEAVQARGVSGHAVSMDSGADDVLILKAEGGQGVRATLRVLHPSFSTVIEADGVFAIEAPGRDLRPELRARVVISVSPEMPGRGAVGDTSGAIRQSASLVSAANAIVAALTSTQTK